MLRKRCRISGENAGVHLLLHFQDGTTEEELIQSAEARDVRVYGLSQYFIGPRKNGQATILLGYANIDEEKIQEAVKILAEAWK